MTNKELNEKVKTAKCSASLRKLNAQFEYFKDEMIVKEGFTAIYQYVKSQHVGWNRLSPDLMGTFQSNKKIFDSLFDSLNKFISDVQSFDETSMMSKWNTTVLPTLKLIKSDKILAFDSPIVAFLLSQRKIGEDEYQGARRYLYEPTKVLNINKVSVLNGVLNAYEFENQNQNTFTKRSRAEKSSISRLRADFEKYYNRIEKEISDLFNDSSEKQNEYNLKLKRLEQAHEEQFAEWFSTCQQNFSEFEENSNRKVIELESLYSEKLMLEKPAIYWAKRAEKLKEEGHKWLWGLILVSTVGLISLVTILGFLSNGSLNSVFSEVSIAVRWSVVFLTIVSLLAYAIKTFSKLTFSSFHLARDAEERQQLVYVYLALKKDSMVENEERQLILQSLFSRAESGLLKDDASPAMPGSNSLIDRLFSK